MNDKIRTSVYLEREQLESIKEQAKKSGLSTNEYIVFQALNGGLISKMIKLIGLLEDLLPKRGGGK